MALGIAAKWVATLCLGAAVVLPARAEAESAAVRINFTMEVDCSHPLPAYHLPIHGEFTGHFGPDPGKAATADLSLTALLVFSSHVHFVAQPGGAPYPATVGSSSIKILSNDRVRANWDLPNNVLSFDIEQHAQSCNATLTVALKPGKGEYSLYGGGMMNFCSRAEVRSVSCEVR